MLDVMRRRFIAGLFTIIPAAFTIWIIRILLGILDANLGKHIKKFVVQLLEWGGWPMHLAEPITIGVSLVLALGFILLVGVLMRFFVVRRLIHLGEQLVAKIPLIRFFYQTPKEVIKILTTQKGQLKRIVMVEWPRPGLWALAYATGETIDGRTGSPMVTLFMPTTPNPTTGFLMIVSPSQVLDINIGTEDAMRVIMSGGILLPNHYHTAPFAGLTKKPDLPPGEPLTSEAPPELRASRDESDDDLDLGS